MKTKLLNLAFAALVMVLYLGNLPAAHAQTPPPPDCVIPFAFTSSGSGSHSFGNFDNRTDGCQTYTVTYTATQTSGGGSLTMDFQSAGGALTPGSFATWASGGGTVNTGINPNTSVTHATSTFSTGCVNAVGCTVTNSWVRVLLTPSGLWTGAIWGVMYGYKTGYPGGGTGGGSTACPGTVGTPCVTAGVKSGAAAQANVFCDKTGGFTISAATDVVVIAGTGGITTEACGISAAWDNAADVTLEQGSGVTCGSSTATLAGPYKGLTAFAFDYGAWGPQHPTATGLDICLHFSTSVSGGGGVAYAK